MHYEHIDIRHSEQLEGDFCGCACAQVVIAHKTMQVLDQYAISGETRDGSWGSSPAKLSGFVQTNITTSAPSNYDVIGVGSAAALARKLCWSIEKHGEAPIVLVYGLAHWIVVHGYLAVAPPGESNQTSFTPSHFFIMNPYMKRSIDSIQRDVDLLEVVPYVEWTHAYHYAPVPCDPGDATLVWNYIAITDGDEAVALVDERYVANIAPTPVYLDPTVYLQKIDDLFASDPVLSGISPWNDVWHQVEHFRTKRSRDSIWIGDDSYFVSYRWKNGIGNPNAIPLLVRISAIDGSFRGAVVVPDGSSYLEDSSSLLDREMVTGYLEEHGITLEKDGIQYHPDYSHLDDELYWQPCLESLSPFLPFWIYRFPNGQEDETAPDVLFYVRLDGQIFPELHPAVGA